MYNDNSNPLLGDFVLPNSTGLATKRPKNINKVILADRSVKPLQPTAINRGYMDGVLDEEGKLKTFTSACGPIIFQGTGLPDSYYNNAFVCGPEVNLGARKSPSKGLELSLYISRPNSSFVIPHCPRKEVFSISHSPLTLR